MSETTIIGFKPKFRNEATLIRVSENLEFEVDKSLEFEWRLSFDLSVQLVTPNWHETVYRNLEETLDPEGQVRPLYNRVSCHLLGEEFQVTCNNERNSMSDILRRNVLQLMITEMDLILVNGFTQPLIYSIK